jgi:hypothetical protein
MMECGDHFSIRSKSHRISSATFCAHLRLLAFWGDLPRFQLFTDFAKKTPIRPPATKKKATVRLDGSRNRPSSTFQP